MFTDENSQEGGAILKVKSESPSLTGRLNHSEEERYITIMKELQFGKIRHHISILFVRR